MLNSLAAALMNASTVTNAGNDPLAKGPPLPALPDAKRAKGRQSGPSGATGMDLSSIASSLIGGPTQIVMSGMMQIEKIVKQLAQISPEIAQVFAPAIEQARDIAAASLGNISQGSSGALTQDVGAPAPAAIGPAGQAGPGAGGMSPMPMPM
jgi:hypothetical protein